MADRSIVRDGSTRCQLRFTGASPIAVSLIAACLCLAAPAFGDEPYLVKDIIDGPGGSSPLNLTAVGDKVFFAPADDGSGRYRNLWVSNGTEGGTYREQWINEDPVSDEGATQLFEAAGILYFRAFDNINGVDLWKSDPGTGVTAPVQDISPDYYTGQFTLPLCEFRHYLFFTADDGIHGSEPWITNGTYAEMIENIRLVGGSAPSGGVDYHGFLYFTAQTTEHGAELWVSDLTMPTTNEVADIVPGPGGSNPRDHTVAGAHLFFTAVTPGEGKELWQMNDSGAVALVRDIRLGTEGSDPQALTAVGDNLLFFADDGQSGCELWRSTGVGGITERVKDIWQGPLSGIDAGDLPPGTWATTGELFFFVANDGTHGKELWVSDGTAIGTHLVRNIHPSTSNNFPPAEFAVIGDHLYFRAEDTGGTDVWVSDGTEAGTLEITGTVPGGLSYPTSLVNVYGDLFFVAYQDATGAELWKLPLAIFEDGFESGDTDAW